MKKRSRTKAEQYIRWEIITLIAIISLFLMVILSCFWYYLAVYSPFVNHFIKTQEFFDYIFSLYVHHRLS